MPDTHDHDPTDPIDGGLIPDSARILTRRRLILAAGLGLAGAAGLALRPVASAAQPLPGTAAEGSQCTLPAAETAGPYPADGTNARAGQTVNVLAETGVERSDLTGSFAGYSGRAEGIPLALEITLLDARAACAPLAGRALYLWHCDAQGRYSLYAVPEANWLRGLQVSDANGRVRFATILPGCYDGRWPHLHFEVFDSRDAAATGREARLTSQFALPGAPLAALYAADSRYGASAGNLARASLARDMVFGDNGAAQMAAMTLALSGDAGGLRAEARIAIG